MYRGSPESHPIAIPTSYLEPIIKSAFTPDNKVFTAEANVGKTKVLFSVIFEPIVTVVRQSIDFPLTLLSSRNVRLGSTRERKPNQRLDYPIEIPENPTRRNR